jgi:hypothetical protein
MLGIERPFRGLGELEAILDRILEKAVKPTGRWGGLAPDEVLAKKEPLFAKPEDDLVLQSATLAAVALGSIVEDEGAMWLECPKNLFGDLEEEAGVPVAFVLLSVPVLGLPVVRGRGYDRVEGVVRKRSKEGEAVADGQPPKRTLEASSLSRGTRNAPK